MSFKNSTLEISARFPPFFIPVIIKDTFLTAICPPKSMVSILFCSCCGAMRLLDNICPFSMIKGISSPSLVVTVRVPFSMVFSPIENAICSTFCESLLPPDKLNPISTGADSEISVPSIFCSFTTLPFSCKSSPTSPDTWVLSVLTFTCTASEGSLLYNTACVSVFSLIFALLLA